MDKEAQKALFDWLQANVSLRVEASREVDYGNSSSYLSVALIVINPDTGCDEVIASADVHLR